ncbi:MAG: anti-sigma factor antagonist [Acutalibacteraceae bacterium]
MNFECRQTGSVMTVEFLGDIDEYACRTMREEIDGRIEKTSPKEVVFDMEKVAFVDSTGLGLILGRYKKLRAKGGVLRLKNVPPQVDKVFRTSGVYSVVEKIR